MQNVLAEHEMFDKFGGGEMNKQGQAVETISCQANYVSQFHQASREQLIALPRQILPSIITWQVK